MIFDKMKDLVAEQFGVDPDEITMETSFVEDLDADSIDIVELMMAAEEAFGIGEVEENALENVKTVGDIVNYIKDRI
ncbi:MAG: acyl carrier protein [Clostridiaceae bacterium]|nr:acyl carrier protein [Clostridiaceae bacterium]